MPPRFTVESWSPDYGAPLESMPEEEEGRTNVDASFERSPDEWSPIVVEGPAARNVMFVDGVQRIDARVWVSDNGLSRMGLCVSLAAGLVCSNGRATVEDVLVRRYAFGPGQLGTIECNEHLEYRGVPVDDANPAKLDSAVAHRREELEIEVAHKAASCDLMVVDGRIRQRESIAGAIGFLKTHRAMYLKPEQARVVGQLGAGERTPIFILESSDVRPWSRYSWYLRLPGGAGHDWAGIVRCEASPSLTRAEVVQLADTSAATLPRFASHPYKDPRAPQNLYPVGSLERELRRHLGDATWLMRALQRASHF